MARVLAVAGLLTTVLLFAGCRPNRQSEDVGDTIAMNPNCNTGFSGELKSQQMNAIRNQAQDLDPAGAWVKHDEKAVAIQPLCESHKKSEQDLGNGQFVARMMIVGESTPYSKLTTDMVYMWVFERAGQKIVQFVSMTNPNHDDALVPFTWTWCTATPPTEEQADWHEGVCSAHTETGGRPRGGDNPWFGCTRGCCYAAAPVDEG